MAPERITDPDEIRRLVAEHGRWWHEIELAPGIVTPGDDSNRMKLPILDELGLPSDLTGIRALEPVAGSPGHGRYGDNFVGVQISLAATALMGAVALGVRFIRRGERVLSGGDGASPAAIPPGGVPA